MLHIATLHTSDAHDSDAAGECMEVLKRSVNVSQLKSVFKSAEQVNGFRGVVFSYTTCVYIDSL